MNSIYVHNASQLKIEEESSIRQEKLRTYQWIPSKTQEIRELGLRSGCDVSPLCSVIADLFCIWRRKYSSSIFCWGSITAHIDSALLTPTPGHWPSNYAKIIIIKTRVKKKLYWKPHLQPIFLFFTIPFYYFSSVLLIWCCSLVDIAHRIHFGSKQVKLQYSELRTLS